MAFPDDIIEKRKKAVGYQCECALTNCGHKDRCTVKTNLEGHHINGNTSDNSYGNCRILCHPCHEKTRSFGAR